MSESPAKKQCRAVPGIKLNNGAEIPCFGLGTWKSGPGEVQKAVVAALECGYRHIDCASIYGNEGEVGAALKETTVPREQIFITSKLFNHDHSAADVEVACRASMEKLGVGYLDLYLIHWPVCLKKGAALPPKPEDVTDVPIKETWAAMEALVEKGLVRAIGVSNFSVKKIEEIMAFAKVKPAVNQVEGHPYLAQPKLKEFCDANGIVVTAYSPLGSPDRPARVLDTSDPILLEDETLKAIATRVGRTPAEVLIRWAVQRGTVVIPKSVTPSRIEQNLQAAMNPLPDDAMADLAKMDRHLRLLKGTLWTPEGTMGPFKTVADLWDEIPSMKLRSGAEMPVFGLGTWKSGPGEVQKAVVAALQCGYRHIDCASIYGNEGEVGAALKESSVARSQIFITSKLFNHDHAAADVEVACRASMQKLGVDYLDLYLIHWPVCLKKGAQLPPKPEDFTDVPIKETWTAMEALVDKGLVRAIGVSNFSAKKMEEIMAFAKIKPAVNQVEGHPYLAQPKLKDFCDANGIVLTAYSPLGSPDRPARVLDVSDPILLEDENLKAIAKRVNRTPAEVLIRWAVQRGTVVIPKSVTPSRIEQNMRAALNPLPEDAMLDLANMNRNLRLLKGTLWTPEGTTGPIKTVGDLWDE